VLRTRRQLRLETSGDLIGDWDSDRLAQVGSNLGGAPISPAVIPFIFEAVPAVFAHLDSALTDP